METRQYWVCATCGGGYFAGEVGKVHVTLSGLVCRRCVPFLGEGAPRPPEGRMRKAEAPPPHVEAPRKRAAEQKPRTMTRARIASILRARPDATGTEIARELGITKQSVSKHIAAMPVRAVPLPRCLRCGGSVQPVDAAQRPTGVLHRGACARAWDVAQACARAGVA